MSDAKDVVRRLEEAWAANDLATVDGLLAPDLVSHDMPPGMPPGREGAKAAHMMSMSSFPDRRMTIEDVVGDGDRVAVRTTIRGTNTGGVPWLGVPANGKQVEVESISIYRVANGTVVEHWGQNDVGRLMMQLGAASPTPTASA
jgi:predicted ester cyclase